MILTKVWRSACVLEMHLLCAALCKHVFVFLLFFKDTTNINFSPHSPHFMPQTYFLKEKTIICKETLPVFSFTTNKLDSLSVVTENQMSLYVIWNWATLLVYVWWRWCMLTGHAHSVCIKRRKAEAETLLLHYQSVSRTGRQCVSALNDPSHLFSQILCNSLTWCSSMRSSPKQARKPACRFGGLRIWSWSLCPTTHMGASTLGMLMWFSTLSKGKRALFTICTTGWVSDWSSGPNSLCQFIVPLRMREISYNWM